MQAEPNRRSSPEAYAGGWILLGLVTAIVAEASGTGSDPLIRIGRHAVDLGRHIAVGLLALAVAWAWRRVAPSSRVLATLGLWLCGIAVGSVLLPDDVEGIAERTGEDLGLPQSLMMIVVIVGIGASLPAAMIVGRVLGHGVRRIGILVLVVAGVVFNGHVSPFENPSLHFFVSWFLAQLAAETLVGPCLALRRLAARGRVARAWLVAGVVVAVGWAVVAVVVRPSNAVTLELGRFHGSLLTSHFARLQSEREIHVDDQTPTTGDADNPFFVDRSDAPPIEPSEPPLLAADAIVVFLTIDAFRYDVLADPRYETYVPNIGKLREEGVSFASARTPGSQTVYTMSAMSTGRYFSQRYWSKMKGTGSLWPHEDDSVHFPELLRDRGVRCIMIPGSRWMVEKYGLWRGFEITHAPKSRGWTHGTKITDKLSSILREAGEGPMLVYAHYFDSHSPYNRGGTDCEEFECYLREIQWVDREIGRVRDVIDELGLSSRVVLIVSADHGESFGEHGAKFHASTLYDVALRVPLLFAGPRIEAREVDDLVSLIDIGPTLLDLFGVATPGQFMGQSLVPYLRGESPTLQRPIAAEGRLKQAMVFDDGIKVIHDGRTGTTEIYDLDEDPGELDDQSASTGLEESRHFTLLRTFFRVHELQRPGYETPYRK